MARATTHGQLAGRNPRSVAEKPGLRKAECRRWQESPDDAGHGNHHPPVAAVAGGSVVGVLPADPGGFANIASVPASGVFPRATGDIAPGLRVFLGYSRPATPTVHLPLSHQTRVRVRDAEWLTVSKQSVNLIETVC